MYKNKIFILSFLFFIYFIYSPGCDDSPTKPVEELDKSLVWDITYSSEKDADCGSSIVITNDDNYMITTITNGLKLIKADTLGNIIFNKEYFYKTTPNVLIGTIDSCFAALTYYNQNVVLVKADDNGDTIWTKQFSLTGTISSKISLIQTSDKGFLINVCAHPELSDDIFLIKTDSEGNLIWNKTYTYEKSVSTFSCIETNDNGYIIVGSITSNKGNGRDIYIIKTDDLGDILWQRTYGGADNEYAYAIVSASESEFVITGNTKSFGNNDKNVLLLKIDEYGNLIWLKTVNGEFGFSLITTNDGGYAITGSTDPPYKIILIKTDAFGNQLWYKEYSSSNFALGYAIAQTKDDGFIISGGALLTNNLYYNLRLIKTDANGNTK